MSKKEGAIVILSGPSGVGKSTLINRMKSRFREFIYIPSMTTRERREGESQGSPYYFVTNKIFDENVSNKKFIEYNNNVHGKRYGTLRQPYEQALTEGKIIFKDIDVEGASELIEEFKDNIISIFVTVSNIKHLEGRLLERNESPHSIKKRLERMEYELSLMGEMDYVLYNNYVGEASEELEKMVRRALKDRAGAPIL